MNNTDIMLKEIFTSDILTKRQKILKSEKKITEILNADTTDLELYFKLAAVVLEEPEVDFIKSMECMEKVLILDKTNKEAIIFLSWLQYFYRGYVNSETLILLDSLLKCPEIDSLSKSLIYLAKSWSDEINEEQRFYFLEESIKNDDTYVNNYFELANLYHAKGDLNKEQYLIIKALRNVEKIYLVDETFNVTVIREYLGDCFNGVINIPTYDIPTYKNIKKESILRTVIDSNTMSNILENILSRKI